MKRIYTSLLAALLWQFATAQVGFFFNIHQPSSLHHTYQPGEFSSIPIADTSWGWNGTIPTPVIGEMVYAPEDLSTQLHTFCTADAIDYTGKIVMIDRGSCEFSLKALNAQNQGAIGVVIVNFEDAVVNMGAGSVGAQVTIPLIMVPQSMGQLFINEITNGGTVVASFANDPINLAKVKGKLTFDENNDCTAEAGEPSLGNWQVQAVNGSNTYFATTKPDGSYQLYLDFGDAIVTVNPPSSNWVPCGNGYPVSFSQYDSTTVDFEVKALQHCPQMSVDLEAPFLRRCFDNYYKLVYCNSGSAVAEDATVTVTFPSLFTIVSTSAPYTDLGNGSLEFQLGDIGIGQCGEIFITANLSCDADFGETYCVVAEAAPFDPCVPTGTSSWTGAEIRVTGECENNTAVFVIKNVGTGDMAEPRQYTILKDGQFQESQTFQLAAGSTMTFGLDTDGGATLRMEAEQEVNFPFFTFPAANVEGCPSGDDSSLGFINIFPPAYYGVNYDEECNEVIGSYDPNDKTGFPLGYGPHHYIERNTNIEYLIRFQNTGTDTAFNVVVRDTVTDKLDLSTLRLGLSSHPYELKIVDGNVLEFSFKNIHLLDSFTNEPASHGYLYFTLAQKAGLPIGTVIKNKAGIYFDFNEPVITNETWHEIGENFINSATAQVFRKDMTVGIAPNPMDASTIFDLGDVHFQTGKMELYDMAGRLLRTQQFDANRFEFNRGDLVAGSFVFKIFLDGQPAAAGNLLVK